MTYKKKYALAKSFTRLEAPKVDSRRVAKNTLILYFRMLVVMLVSLYTSRVLLQALGVANFGLHQVAMATVAMFAILNGSLSLTSSRFLTVEMGSGKIGNLKRVFSTVLTVHFFMALFVAILLETIGVFILGTKLNIAADRLFAVKWAFHCGVIATIFNITQVPYTAIIVAHERMSAFAYMTFFDTGVKLLIVYLLFVSPFDRLIVYATLLMLTSCITVVIYRIYCIRHFTESRRRRVFDMSVLKSISGFMGWQFLSHIVLIAITQMATLLNQHYFGPEIVAANAIGNSVLACVNGFINNFKTAANPQIMKLYATHQFEQSKMLLIETIHYTSFLLLIIGVPICFYAPEILHLWLGDNVPPYTVEFVRIILIGAFLGNFSYSMFTVISADGRMKNNTLCDVVLYPLTFVGIWLSITLTGCPFSSAIGQSCLMLVLAFAAKPLLLKFMSYYSFQDFLKMFLPPLLALTLCLGLAYMIYCNLPKRGFLFVINCFIVAFLESMVVFVLVASDKVQRQILRLLRRGGAFGGKVAGLLELVLDRSRAIRRAIGVSRLFE